MGLGVLSLVNKFLSQRGLVIKDRDLYEEKLQLVNNNWMQKLEIKSIIDIGASTGGYATKARSIFPNAHIYSFEPLPKPYLQLCEKFKNDKLHSTFNLVCSDKSGLVDFFENDYSGSSSMIEMANLHKEAYPKTVNATKIQVKSTSLDEVLLPMEPKKNILLKIDVQGSESLVLNGAINTLKDVKLIFIETSFNELYKNQWLFNDTYQFLCKHGFRLIGIENVSQNLLDGTFLQMDAYFIKD